MKKSFNYFKDKSSFLAWGFIIIVTVLFAIFYSPWCLIAMPAYAALFYLMRNNP